MLTECFLNPFRWLRTLNYLKKKPVTTFYFPKHGPGTNELKVRFWVLKKKMMSSRLGFVLHTDHLRKRGRFFKGNTLLTLRHRTFQGSPRRKSKNREVWMCNSASVCRSSALRTSGLKQKCTDTKDSSLKTTWRDTYPGDFLCIFFFRLFADMMNF